jgi:hypothetical protein
VSAAAVVQAGGQDRPVAKRCAGAAVPLPFIRRQNRPPLPASASSHPDRRSRESAAASDDLISVCMGDLVEPRRALITERGREVADLDL